MVTGTLVPVQAVPPPVTIAVGNEFTTIVAAPEIVPIQPVVSSFT